MAMTSISKHLKWLCPAALVGVLLVTFSASSAYGLTLGLRFGPPSLGSGGTNPIGLPPGAIDMDFNYVTKDGFEGSFSVAPGLLFGLRTTMDQFYVGWGAGVVLDSNGVGPGIYTSFGFTSAKGSGFHVNAEYKQAAAYNVINAGTDWIFPYACRVGVEYEF